MYLQEPGLVASDAIVALIEYRRQETERRAVGVEHTTRAAPEVHALQEACTLHAKKQNASADSDADFNLDADAHIHAIIGAYAVVCGNGEGGLTRSPARPPRQALLNH